MKKILFSLIFFLNIFPFIHQGKVEISIASVAHAQYFGDEDEDPGDDPGDDDDDDDDDEPEVTICSRSETNSFISGNLIIQTTCWYNCTNGANDLDRCNTTYIVIDNPNDPDPEDPEPDPTDCAGVIGGSAYTSSCGCIGGTTGISYCPEEPQPPDCSIGVTLMGPGSNYKPGEAVPLFASETVGANVSITNRIFEVWYMNQWYEIGEATVTSNNMTIIPGFILRVLGDLKFRVRIEYSCNNNTAEVTSNEVPVNVAFCASDFKTKFAIEMNVAWSLTVSATNANPGTKFEQGFVADFKSGSLGYQISNGNSSVPCATNIVGISFNVLAPPTSSVDPSTGFPFTVGHFHTHPPLTYCPSNTSLVAGPSSQDSSTTTQYPRIVRTYTQTVNGGHNINLPTTDFTTNSLNCTTY